ncbi:MAG: DUF378 domain-containing protein [Candidatus Gastranaerophilaceae bacterium]
MYALRLTAFILVLVGALNWGLVGLFGFDAVAFLFGNMSILSRIVYCLVGLSAICFLFAELKYLRYKD